MAMEKLAPQLHWGETTVSAMSSLNYLPWEIGNGDTMLSFFPMEGIQTKYKQRVEGAIICLLILAVDVAAGVLGIEAEMAQNKGRHLRVFFFECKEPVQQAYKLGIAAAALLALSHAVANVLGGCTCICSRDQWDNSMPNKQMAAVALLFSWIVVVVGFTMLMIGAMSNSKSRVKCGLAHRHFLSIGGILCFVHAVFCMVYYVSAHASIKEEEGKARRNIRSHGVQA